MNVIALKLIGSLEVINIGVYIKVKIIWKYSFGGHYRSRTYTSIVFLGHALHKDFLLATYTFTLTLPLDNVVLNPSSSMSIQWRVTVSNQSRSAFSELCSCLPALHCATPLHMQDSGRYQWAVHFNLMWPSYIKCLWSSRFQTTFPKAYFSNFKPALALRSRTKLCDLWSSLPFIHSIMCSSGSSLRGRLLSFTLSQCSPI